jgi:hypothetical protein
VSRVADDPNVRRYDEPVSVDVLHEGRWYRGFCRGWARRDDGTWRAAVEYSVAPGEKYVRSVAADRVRPADV